MNLAKYAGRRLVGLVPVVFGVTVITFLLSQVIPADPATVLAGDAATPDMVASIKHQYGLDRSPIEQYGHYVWRLLHGDLGTSIFSGRPVRTDLASRFAATFELATVAIVVALVLGVALGALAAVHRGSVVDQITRVIALFGAAVPVFWLAIVLVYFFYSKLGWFPATGRVNLSDRLPTPITRSVLIDSLVQGRWHTFVDALRHIVLPAGTLAIMGAGVIARVTRASMLDVLDQEYIRAARAKGLSRRRVVYVHALRNALLPTVTVAGITYGSLLGGAVLTETVFNWPGLGNYAVSAMFRSDYPALMGVVLVMALAYAVINLVVDVVYVLLNPVVTV
jgi:peptide/nickel transport system permease protein